MTPAAEQDPSTKYELRHQIGKGSFGSAFLVTNKHDKKEYVLKRVRLAKQTKWQRNSTLQERDLAAALRHPFIVPCVESWLVQNHTVNMIYAFCQNGDLASYLHRIRKQGAQVDEGLMQKWLCQLLLALDYLQTQQVLHRDIKTSNLMLTCDNDVQLGDFGLATLMQDDGEESKPQDTNLVGTPHYMSPELLSCKSYGFKTDVWSLGCVFYELTAQRPTFNAFNIHGLVSKIKKSKLAPLPTNYSNEWKDIVHLMLCKNPDRRPSVQQLMGLPALRPAMLEARARARELLPDVQLPPLLDPTPLTPQPLLTYRFCGSQHDVADESEGSAGSTSDQHACCRSSSVGGGSEAESSRASCRHAERWSAPALSPAHALRANELTELWKGSIKQQQWQQEPLDTDTGEPHQQQQPQQDEGQSSRQLQQQQTTVASCAEPSSCSDRNSKRGMGSPRSQGSRSSSPAGMRMGSNGLPAYSPHAAVGTVIDGYKRMAPQASPAAQPGIKRTPSERVAAAIAAADSGRHAAVQQFVAGSSGGGSSSNGRRTAAVLSTTSQRRSSSAASPSSTPRQSSGVTSTPRTLSARTTRRTSSGGVLTPRVPSSSGAAASVLSARDSKPSNAKSGTSSSAGTAVAGAKQLGKAAAGATAAVSKTPAATPLPPASPLPSLARRSMPVQRYSDRGTESAGGAKQPATRPPWSGGGSSRPGSLTPGRQKVEQQSPILKALNLHGAAAAQAVKQAAQRTSLGRRVSSRLMGGGSGASAGGAESGTTHSPHTQPQQQQHQQISLVASVAASTADAGLACHPAAAAEAAANAHQQLAQDAMVAPAASSKEGSDAGQPKHVLGSKQRRSSSGAGLPPLPLHKLHQMHTELPQQQQRAQQQQGQQKQQQYHQQEQEQQTPTELSSPFSAASPAFSDGGSSTSSGCSCDDSAIKQLRFDALGSPMPQQGSPTTSACIAATPTAAGAAKEAAGANPDDWLDSRADGKAMRQSSIYSSSQHATSSASSQSNGSSRSGSAGGSRSSLQGLLDHAGSREVIQHSCRRSGGEAIEVQPDQPRQQQQQQQSPEQRRQRLDLLESAMVVIAGLAARRRWTELSSVLSSPGLLPQELCASLAAGAEQEGSSVSEQSAGAGKNHTALLKLGDIVVLGRSSSVKGRIRYIGPVAWDPSASEWVGMELERPCGIDAIQRGIVYFDCQPKCASFHRVTDLTSFQAS